jgi:hypothetical protein
MTILLILNLIKFLLLIELFVFRIAKIVEKHVFLTFSTLPKQEHFYIKIDELHKKTDERFGLKLVNNYFTQMANNQLNNIYFCCNSIFNIYEKFATFKESKHFRILVCSFITDVPALKRLFSVATVG